MISRIIRAPRGTQLSAKSWLTEAPLRMLMNNLDPEVAERPEDLVVYGGIGKAARNWECFEAIVEVLKALESDETLLVQSGKPVGVFKTHPDAPRVLIANSNLVPNWANWEHFNQLDRKGLMMYGQMTAGSWIYIGSQGIVQGTYETFAEAGRRHYGGDWSGKWILTAGLGGMGGAQPLAATMAGASMLAIECDPSRIEMRLKSGYLDKRAANLEEAMSILGNSSAPVSVGLLGNAAEVLPEILKKAKIDAVSAFTGNRPDLGARPGQRLPARALVAREVEGPAQARARRGRAVGARVDRQPRPGDPAVQGDGNSLRRLRQQHPPGSEERGREECVRLPGLRAGVRAAAVLRRQGSLPLGRALGRSGGHREDRRQGP